MISLRQFCCEKREGKGQLLFFAFEQAVAPDYLVEPVVKALPPMRTGNHIYHLKDDDNPESTRYYGSTDRARMDNLRRALREEGVAFQEVPEEELPERERRQLANIRRNS